MSQSIAQPPAAAIPERAPARKVLDALGRSLIGSDRPWDPANRFGLIILCLFLIMRSASRTPTSSRSTTPSRSSSTSPRSGSQRSGRGCC